MATFSYLDHETHCPIELGLSLVGRRWKPRVLFALRGGRIVRFKELGRRLEGISDKVLTTVLKELVSDGLVHRTVSDEMPVRVDYRLSERGQELLDVLEPIRQWGLVYKS